MSEVFLLRGKPIFVTVIKFKFYVEAVYFRRKRVRYVRTVRQEMCWFSFKFPFYDSERRFSRMQNILVGLSADRGSGNL